MIADSSLIPCCHNSATKGKQIAKREKVTAVVRGVENRDAEADEWKSVQNPAAF
jgi:hypothetical protein